MDATVRLAAREGYAVWADTYPPRAHNRLMAAEQEIVEPIIRSASPRRALDVGTGTGRYLGLLHSAGATFIVGVDMSLPMLEHRCCATPRVCGDACQLPFADGQFDFVCSSLMVGDVADLDPWIAEATRVLAPGGHLVYSDFHPSWTTQQWRRTFRAADGRQFELNYFPHTIGEHLERLERASLEISRDPRAANRRSIDAYCRGASRDQICASDAPAPQRTRANVDHPLDRPSGRDAGTILMQTASGRSVNGDVSALVRAIAR
jgi:malonyl-CoA O-methyltransferase